MLPGIAGMMSGAAASGLQATVVTIGSKQETGSTLAADFNYTIDIASTNSSKRVFLVIHWTEGGTHRNIDDVDIDSVNATIGDGIQEGHSGGLTGFGVAIMHVPLPTQSGSVTAHVSFDGNVIGCAITPIVVTGLTETTAFDEAFDENSGTSTNLSANIAIPASDDDDSIVIAAYTGSTGISDAAVSWSGVTEQYDTGTLDVRTSMGVAEALAQDAARAILLTMSGEPDSGNAIVVQSWT
jgi:hypothetical protein